MGILEERIGSDIHGGRRGNKSVLLRNKRYRRGHGMLLPWIKVWLRLNGIASGAVWKKRSGYLHALERLLQARNRRYLCRLRVERIGREHCSICPQRSRTEHLCLWPLLTVIEGKANLVTDRAALRRLAIREGSLRGRLASHLRERSGSLSGRLT